MFWFWIRRFVSWLFVSWLPVVGLALCFLAACDTHYQDVPYYDNTGAGGSFITTGSGGDASCEEENVPVPDEWQGPSLFVIGPFSDLPACPDIAPFPGMELYSELSAEPLICPKCECTPSETTCSVPLSWHASAASCAEADGAETTPFDAPPGWDGSCNADSGIDASAMCNGEPCIQSVTVGAPEVSAAPCSPIVSGGIVAPPIEWALRARQCLPAEPGAFPLEPPSCAPPSGMSLCIHRDGDHACPETHPDKHLFFHSVSDQRGCLPCACGPPEGNHCIALVKAYSTLDCGPLTGAINVASGEGSGCFDVPPGLSLFAKTAEIVALHAGACSPSGGAASGFVLEALPVTVCCRRDDPPR